jgi:adhesin transport system membrane fusion protein
MRASDFAYANDIRAAVELRTPRTWRLLVQTVGALVLAAFVWAYFAVLDEVTRGNARVVPSRQTQVVQTLEGGIVEAINIQEGAIVQRGQILMRIDDTNFASQLGEVRERRAAMAVRVARLDSEAAGRTSIEFPADLDRDFSRLAVAERSLFDARARRLAQDLEVLQQQEDQRRREKDELQAQASRISSSLNLLDREAGITRRLHQTRVVPEIEMIRLDRQVAEARGQLAVARASLARIDVAIQEAAGRRASAIQTFRATAEEELVRSRGDLAVLEETIRSAEDRVRRVDLRSPVYGIVNRVNVTTVGAVVQSAQSLVEIVPLDDTLLVEAQVRPADIAFIRPDQEAVVKITAYDPLIYGSLSGRVERISADTTANDNGDTFYRVTVRTTRNHLGTAAAPLSIIPGMVGTVEVLTGQRTVLDYMLRPLRRTMSEALRER